MPSVETTLVDADFAVLNGVVHIVDKPLMKFLIPDIIRGLEDYASKSEQSIE